MAEDQSAAAPSDPYEKLSAKEKAECRKLDAERAKIEAETLDHRGWRLGISKFAAVSPAIIAILAAVFLWKSRWFESQTKLLEIDRRYLTETNVLLQAKGMALNETIRDLEAQRDAALMTNQILVSQLRNFASALKTGAIRITADSSIRIDEAGNIRVTEPGAVLTQGDGTILTDGQGNAFTIGPDSTNSLLVTNSPPRARQK